MHGVKRVLIFCLLTTFMPIFLLVMPLYLRHKLYADVVYAVTESDIMEISDGVSTMFCSAHTLYMNSTFNAFQMGHKPEVTSYRKHIRLKKSMTLPDDTLEYWGFYLLRGATVALSVCSKSPGASILVVKGQRSLSTCGLLDHNENKARRNGIFSPSAQNQVKITFETNAQLIESRETPRTSPKTPGLPQDDKKTQKTLNISSDTLNRLSPSVQFYITDLITSHDLKLQKNDDSKSERRVRHVRKKFSGKIHEKDENPSEIDEKSLKQLIRRRRFIKSDENPSKMDEKSINPSINESKKILERLNHQSSTQKNYYFERTIDYINKLNPRKSRSLLTQQKLELLKSQLETPGSDIAAEEDSKGEKIYISHKYKPPKDTHEIRKRSLEPVKPPALLDRGIKHGGNAFMSPVDDESSASSFENGLFDCYQGNILLATKFAPTNCESIDDLLNGEIHMQTHHNVTEDGYYYYIFYSDNDFVSNDMHALFDIWKPTFQYENVTKSCVNVTECTFPLEIMSGDRVIVEIPTRDGIEHEADDMSLLVSVCHPRVGIYVVFPIAVLLFIISCAFL